jgi:hypothetical protein
MNMRKETHLLLLLLILSISCAKSQKEAILLRNNRIEKLIHHADRIDLRRTGKEAQNSDSRILLKPRMTDYESMPLERESEKDHIIPQGETLKLDLIFNKYEKMENVSSITFALKTSGEILISLYSSENGHKLFESSFPPLNEFIPIEIPLDTIKMKYLMGKELIGKGKKETEKEEQNRLFLKIDNKENQEIHIHLGDFQVKKFMEDSSLSVKSVKIFEENMRSIVFPLPNEIQFTLNPQTDFYIQGYLGNKTNPEITYALHINGKKTKDCTVQHNQWEFIQIPVTHSNKTVLIKIKSDSAGMGILGNFMLVPQDLRVMNNQRIIIYLVDALRADFGGVDYSSLELSEVFKDGIHFKNAYSNATHTRDSLPVLFTGIYKYILNNNLGDNPYVYDEYETIAEHLDKKGFLTAAFSANSWLLLSNSSQGFDYVYHHYSKIDTKDISNTSPDIDESDYEEMKNGEILSEAQKFIEANLDKPLFIYIHTMEPHGPYGMPKRMRRYSSRWKDGILRKIRINTNYFSKLKEPSEEELDVIKDFYKDEVLVMSRNFHSFYEVLKNSAIHEKTLLIFTSDHGERLFEHQGWSHGDSDIYNEVIRIPLFVKHPDSSPQIIEKNVSLVDIFPTIADYTNDLDQKGEHIGTSLFDLSERKRGVIYADGTKKGIFACIYGTQKIIFGKEEILYFELDRDPFERRPQFLSKDSPTKLGNRNIDHLLESRASLIQKYYRKGIPLQRALSPEEVRRLKSLGYLK